MNLFLADFCNLEPVMYDGRKEEEETLLSEIAPFEVPLPPNGELGSAHSPMCTVQCTALICGALKCTAALHQYQQ